MLNKVVIAEDDESIQHILGAFLGDAGFLCLRAVNGREAVRLVRMHQPDALILDVMMPEMDGYEVVEKLKAEPLCSSIPILMLTSLSSVEDRVKGLEVGADDYLPKPFDIRELVARVRALVRARRAARDRDPTTGLPSGTALEAELDERLRRREPFALLRFDLDGFPAFADHVGFHQADESLATVGRCLADVATGAPESFLAHVGGSDFVLACATTDAERIAREALAAFEAAKETIVPPQAGASPPRLALDITGVDTRKRPVKTADELSRALADAQEREPAGGIRWA